MNARAQSSKSKKEKNFANIAYNYPTMEKEIFAIIREIEKFSIFLAPKPFLI